MHADLPSEDMRRREIGDPLEPNPHRALPGYTDWIRQNGGELRCEVLSVQPELVLKWRYTKEQEETMQTWRCGAVWLHAAWLPEWRVFQGESETRIFRDLEDAVQTLVGNPESTRYTLLVDPNGLFYDRRRLGGDHHCTTSTGRNFCFSVRRGVSEDDTILLAIAF